MLKRLLSASVLLAAIPALSQGGPGGPRMDRGFMGPLGFTRTPVTNAPYSATFTTTSTEKLQDGSTLNHSTTRVVARDSLGRTREEVTLPAHDATGTQHTMVVILDPVAHTVTQLREEQKIAVVHTVPQPIPGAGHHAGDSASHGEEAGYPHGPRPDRNAVKVDLGAQTISGVVANGTRVTRTVPAGELGNTTPLVSTHEEWFSPDLKIEVSRTDVDPFHGTRATKATAISKAEPEAALFKVPAGYSVQQASERAGRRGPGGTHRPGEMPQPHDGLPPAPGV